VPVRVSEPGAEAAVRPAGTLTVVAPGGFRVEGLSLEAAAALLRRLGC
jgi:transposase